MGFLQMVFTYLTGVPVEENKENKTEITSKEIYGENFSKLM